MVHTYQINGLTVQTGDVICTMNGKPDILPGEFWRLVGRLVPGDVDHVSMYLGPEGLCIESGAKGVITFNVKAGLWVSEKMMRKRGHLVDTFYGVAYPLEGRGLSQEMEEQIRLDVAAFALAQVGKKYNLNFLNSNTDEALLLQPVDLSGISALWNRPEYGAGNGRSAWNKPDCLSAGDLERVHPSDGNGDCPRQAAAGFQVAEPVPHNARQVCFSAIMYEQ